MAVSFPAPSLLDQKIVDIDWRIDVVVSTSHSLRRVAVPTVVIAATLSSGAVLTWRLTQDELHQWRFSMAKAVRDLAYLEKKRPPPGLFSGKRRVVV